MSEKIHLTALTAIVTCLLSFSAAEADAQTAGTAADATLAGAATALPWPMQVASGDARFLVYQPQFEKWEGDRLDGRAAVSIQGQDGEADGFGMVWLSARTSTDRASGMVTIRDITLSRAEFPTAQGRGADYLRILREQLAARSWRVALERLEADLQIERATRAATAEPLGNEAPEILYSDRPAILVPIDGEPVLRELAGTSLKRVINTRALMLRDDAAGRFYLYLTDRWLSARTLQGPWTDAAGPRADLGEALRIAREEGDVDLLEDEAGEAAGRPEAVYVSTAPAELLQTDGAPQYAPIEGTRLLQVTNSSNSIFVDLRTQQHYVLISGRWYRARSLRERNWEHVSGAALPEDFAMIPDTHPTAGVRAAVPGTPQAREAEIANQVPQIAAVTRSRAGLEITYDGDAVFDLIPGTLLYRASNAPIPVIRVADDVFYALDNGVWFVAASPYGPWAVATYVPPAVYAIPRSSPLHYVTYVRVYDATPEVVYVGYTPGYLGSYVSSDHVVVYGSGWHYRPWIGSVWYAAPVTWGFGFSIVNSWWYPWRPVVTVGWGWPYYRPYYRPWWGPWHHRAAHHHHRHGSRITATDNVNIGRHGYVHTNVSNIYRRWDRNAVVSPRQSVRVADRRAPVHADRPRSNLRPGTGYIENAVGGRRFIDGRADSRRGDGHDNRRDWHSRDNDRRNRAELPPVRRMDQVRDDQVRRDQVRGGHARNDQARNDLNRRDDGARVDPVRRPYRPQDRADLPPLQRRDVRREQDRPRDRAELPRIQAPHQAQGNAAPERAERRQRAEIRAPGQAPFDAQSPRTRSDGPGRERSQSRQLHADQDRPRAESRSPNHSSPQAIQRPAAPIPAPQVAAPVHPQSSPVEARPQMPRAAAAERRPPVQRSESGGWIQRGVERQQMQGARAPREVQGARAPREVQGPQAPRQAQGGGEVRRKFSGGEGRAQARGNEAQAPRGGGHSGPGFGERR